MKIFCIGLNYVNHVKELGNRPVPTAPVIFMKPVTALLKDPAIFYHPEFSENIHHEIEVVLKVAKNGKSIQPAFALDYIEAVSVGIDFTARDLQSQLKEKKHPWEISKAFDGSALVGKWREFQKHEDIGFRLEKNGNVQQEGNTQDLLFNFEVLITHISKYFTLNKGDLIFTGTPAGVSQVHIGDQIKGFMNEQELFNCTIK